jgi:hypothetical protein
MTEAADHGGLAARRVRVGMGVGTAAAALPRTLRASPPKGADRDGSREPHRRLVHVRRGRKLVTEVTSGHGQIR